MVQKKTVLEHLKYANFHGDPNIGLFVLATDKYAIVPDYIIDASLLAKKAVATTIAGTQFCGLFLAGNSHGLLVPWTISEREHAALKKELRGINICKISSNHTALGNLVVCNDKGAIISPLLHEHAKQISECLGVPVQESELMGLTIVGALCVATNKGLLLDMYATDAEFEFVKKTLKVAGDISTVNFGSEFVKSGILANSKAVLVGSKTTGPEIARIDEALGFL